MRRGALLLHGVIFFALVVGACGKVYSEEEAPPSPPPVDASSISDAAAESTTIEASSLIDSAPAEGSTGDTALYYGACLSELAFNQPAKVFNIYAMVTFSVDTLNIGFQFLAVTNMEPPTTVTRFGVVGPLHSAAARVDTSGSYALAIGTMEIPGPANPISGSDAQIDESTITVRFVGGTGIGSRFCGRLSGQVVKPAVAARRLDPDQNICHFVPITENATTPRFTAADFQSSACPE